MPWTPEEAAEKAALGGEARRQQRDAEASLSSEEKAKRRLARNSERLASVLLRAAFAEKEFLGVVECPSCGADVEVPSLDPKERVAVAIKALEWGVGKPTVQKPASPEEPPPVGLEVT